MVIQEEGEEWSWMEPGQFQFHESGDVVYKTYEDQLVHKGTIN
jgi:hypothetical protein